MGDLISINMYEKIKDLWGSSSDAKKNMDVIKTYMEVLDDDEPPVGSNVTPRHIRMWTDFIHAIDQLDEFIAYCDQTIKDVVDEMDQGEQEPEHDFIIPDLFVVWWEYGIIEGIEGAEAIEAQYQAFVDEITSPPGYSFEFIGDPYFATNNDINNVPQDVIRCKLHQSK